MEPSNPHDQFFKERMNEPEVARDFLRHYLPRDFAAHLDAASAAVVDVRLLELGLPERSSDVVLRIDLARGAGFAWVVIEHKSRPDRWVARQLRRYVCRLSEKGEEEGRPGPPILPLVLYHGPTPWVGPRNYAALVAHPGAAPPWAMDFEPVFVDLGLSSNTPVRGGPLVRTMVLSLRHVYDPRIAEKLETILRPLTELPHGAKRRQALAASLVYLEWAARDRLTPEISDRILERLFPLEMEEIMSTRAEAWIQQGLEKGIEQGRREGRTEGTIRTAREDVIAALRIRFGDVPEPVRSELEGIEDRERLRRLLQEAIVAANLDDFLDVLSRRNG